MTMTSRFHSSDALLKRHGENDMRSIHSSEDVKDLIENETKLSYQARARSARARRACALRALVGLLLADGTPTVGGGKTF